MIEGTDQKMLGEELKFYNYFSFVQEANYEHQVKIILAFHFLT